MSLRAKWQNIKNRSWDEIRDAWMSSVPTFPLVGAQPDPGLDRLLALAKMAAPKKCERFPDIEGMRRLALWEAVYLFHKCSHATLAAQRLGATGMHSWCMFNAYHAAYLGARGIMAALGVELVVVNGAQVLLDLFPEPERLAKKRAAHKTAPVTFSQFIALQIPRLDQRYLWECFQRVLRMSTVNCWNNALVGELLDLNYDEIAPPRNHFLYKACHWPLADLTVDEASGSLNVLLEPQLDADTKGFLLRLCYCVYRLLETLMSDLAAQSAVIRAQINGSRCRVAPDADELASYRMFVSTLETEVA